MIFLVNSKFYQGNCRWKSNLLYKTYDIIGLIKYVEDLKMALICKECGCDDVRNALLNFPGTARHCFDTANHYEPTDRNPGLADPT